MYFENWVTPLYVDSDFSCYYCLISLPGYSPWYNHNGWLGVKHQITYLLAWLQQESVISTASLDSKTGPRRKGRGEGLSGSQAQMYASAFDLSNTFARNDYFSDINPRSMRRLMNIVSVTGL